MASGYFENLHERLLGAEVPAKAALLEVVQAYLDGKPAQIGKRRTTREERDRLFWACEVSQLLTAEQWQTEPAMLALVRYLSQERISVPDLVPRVARENVDALVRAVRFSGLVLRHESPRHEELKQVAETCAPIAELCRVLQIFRDAHDLRLELVQECRKPLDHLNAFELLVFASVYAFRHLVAPKLTGGEVDEQGAWGCIGDILRWKLETQDPKLLSMTAQSGWHGSSARAQADAVRATWARRSTGS